MKIINVERFGNVIHYVIDTQTIIGEIFCEIWCNDQVVKQSSFVDYSEQETKLLQWLKDTRGENLCNGNVI